MRRAGEHDHADQPLEMKQRDQRPGAWFVEQPFGHDRHLAALCHPAPNRIAIDYEPVALEEQAGRVRHCLGRNVERAPLPARRQRQFAAFARNQQQARRAVGDIADCLDGPLFQRGPAIAAADRLGEAQPFGAVIVAMVEQVFGHRDLHPAANPARWQNDQRQHRAGEHKPHLRQRRCSVSQPGERLRRANHRHQIATDHQQRERLERHRPRRTNPALRAARAGDCQHHRHRDQHDPAQHRHRLRLDIAEPCNNVEIEIAQPHRTQRRRIPAQRRTVALALEAIDVLDQHQPAGNDQQPQEYGQFERGDLQRMRGRCIDCGDQQHRMEQLDASQHHQHRSCPGNPRQATAARYQII